MGSRGKVESSLGHVSKGLILPPVDPENGLDPGPLAFGVEDFDRPRVWDGVGRYHVELSRPAVFPRLGVHHFEGLGGWLGVKERRVQCGGAAKVPNRVSRIGHESMEEDPACKETDEELEKAEEEVQGFEFEA